MLTSAEKRRYHRHVMLENVGEEGQEKIKSARVLVVGAGGLGAPVLQYLTAAGVGTMAIMDDDLVSEDNLQRQILYGGEDLGKLKTIIAKQKLSLLNPLVKQELFNIRLKPENAKGFIANYDFVIDASDNFETRYLINDTCNTLGKPWIYGSVNKFEGQVSVFNYKGSRNLRSLFPDVIDKKNIPDPKNSGLFGVIPGIIGSWQANEAIKIITGIGEVLANKLLIFDMLKNEVEVIGY